MYTGICYVGGQYVRVKAHVRFEGEEAINVACILELCAPGGGGWTLSLVRLRFALAMAHAMFGLL